MEKEKSKMEGLGQFQAAIIFCMALIIFMMILAWLLQNNYISMPGFMTRCFFDSECEWVITNCCTERAGANWECINPKDRKPVDCPESVICPQVLSPKPSDGCVCKDGGCTAS